MPTSSLHAQRGVAALTVTLVLFFVMTLIAAYANRNHVFEQRSSVNQYRATQAFEAAEAGLEWAAAMLNNSRHIDADCAPDSGLSGNSFRERYLRYDAAGEAHHPVTWTDGGRTRPLEPVCVRNAQGWECNCPVDGPATLVASPHSAPAPAFSVRFLPGPQAGVVRLVSTGCTSLAGACLPASGKTADAVAHTEVMLGLVSGLATAPVAALTARESVDAGAAAIGLHNPDALSGGIVVHTGGVLTSSNARVTTAPGGLAAAALAEQDSALRGSSSEHLFVSFFGLDKTAWKHQPAVTRLNCEDACSAALMQALESGRLLLWIDGDLLLDGPATLGTPERPILVVASGAVRFRGSVRVHGLVYGASIGWNDAASGAMLRGAAISESGYAGDAAADFVYDAAILAALRGNSGSFARVPGSWKDF